MRPASLSSLGLTSCVPSPYTTVGMICPPLWSSLSVSMASGRSSMSTCSYEHAVGGEELLHAFAVRAPRRPVDGDPCAPAVSRVIGHVVGHVAGHWRPNQRWMRVRPNSTFSSDRATEGPSNVPVGG